jgi:hypothetical protein
MRRRSELEPILGDDLLSKIARLKLKLPLFVVGDVLTDQGVNKAPAYQTPSGGLMLGTMNGYPSWVSTTKLNLGRVVGDGTIEVAAEAVVLGAAGFDLLTTDTLIDANGYPVVTTNSTDVTAGGDFNNVTDPLLVVGAAVTYPGTNLALNNYIKIGTEILKVTVVAGNDRTFARAQFGTVAAAHANGVRIDNETPMAASTYYDFYVSMSTASYKPLAFRSSTTAPTSRDGLGYLAGAGNGTKWRWLGGARLDASVHFVDDATLGRLVGSWYNRKKKSLLLCPTYADTNSNISFGNASVTYARANGGVADAVGFVADNLDADWQWSTTGGSANASRAGLGFDSDTQPEEVAFGADGASTLNMAGTNIDIGPERLAFGYHYLSMLASVGGGGGSGLAFYVALERLGAAANPKASAVYGHVWT